MFRSQTARSLALATLVSSVGLLSFEAFAGELRCNRGQTSCVVSESPYLTVGDRVGIFNVDGELVAYGRVKALRGHSRSVKIEKKHARIRRGDRLALMKKSPDHSSYRIYKDQADLSVGGSLGYATVGIGEGSTAFEFSGFGQWRKWRNIHLVGRATYMSLEGNVSRTTDSIESEPLSMNGFGILGGGAYVFRHNKPLSYRTELAVGGLYAQATVNGDASLVNGEDFPTKVDNGFGFYGRAAVGALWNFDSWRIHADLAQSFIHHALGTSIMGGVIHDIN